MIEIQYKTDEAYSFHAFSLAEMNKEISAAIKGKSLSMAEIVKESEKVMKQKELAAKIGVSSRYLRYIKSGERLSAPSHNKKDKTIRKKINQLSRSLGLSIGGGYKSGQLRAANYLDFVCEKGGEIAKDFHGLFYEHGAMSISHRHQKGLYEVLQNNMRDAIGSMCKAGSYCEMVLLYHRGNKHPKEHDDDTDLCEFCGERLEAVDNKKLVYTVILKK